MFTFKLLKSSIKCASFNQRHVSVASGPFNGLFKSDAKADDTTLQVIDAQDEEIDQEERQARIESLRNKSRLLPQHRNMLHGEVPYADAQSWVHETLKYKRKMYGKFGSQSNVDPRTCFWTKSELEERTEYERVAFPTTVPEMIALNEQQKRVKRDRIIARDEEIAKNLGKLDQWTKDITMRKDKKETEARVAKERKDRLIEEVRRHFGYTIDPRDDRFKEMLETKEREQRKAMKESKRQVKEAKMIEKLVDGKKVKVDSKTEDVSVEETLDENKK